MTVQIEIKQRATLSLAVKLDLVVNGATVESLAGWTVHSQVRRRDGALVATLTSDIVDPEGCIVRLSGDTANWPTAILECDIVAVGPGGSPEVPSDTFQLVVDRRVTQVAP